MRTDIVSFNLSPIPLTRLRVLIADDHPFFRRGLKELLKASFSYIRVIHEANNGEEVLRRLTKEKYDIVFLDLDMPLKDGLNTLKEIRRKYNGQRVIFLSTHNDNKYVLGAHGLSANAYLSKEVEEPELRKCIELVCAGKSYYTPSICEIFLDDLIHKTNENKALSKSIPGTELSPRERDVLKLVCLEYSNKDIGNKLGIAESTAKWHRTNIKSKINCSNTSGMVQYAIKHNIHTIT